MATTTEKTTQEEKMTEIADEGTKKESLMDRYFAESPNPPSEGDLVEGTVVALGKNRIYVDLHPFGTGILFGREYLTAADVLRRVKVGDTIAAKVVEPANREGYIELSLMEARQALIWAEAESAVAKGTPFDLVVREANKGGLMLEWQGIAGFLPASQLKAEHYPRVEDGDKTKILDELRKLVGEKISVTIITADTVEGKLIFSEKGPSEEKGTLIDRLQVGDVVEGEVTGTVDFGVFIKIDEGLEGLVHISEMDWGLVEDPKAMYKVGEKVKVKIIEIKEGKVSLSIKALKEDPWKGAQERYKKGDVVSAVIIKYNKHGALASIEEGVAGLVHISEFESPEKLRTSLELGKTYPFKISLFEPKDHRMTLSTKQA